MSEDNRNYGVDLAKTLAMFLVVVLHLFTKGGVGPTEGVGQLLGVYVKDLSWCCVDLFALVSGYLGVTGHPSFRKWGRLWLQVFITGGLLTLVSHFMLGMPLTGLDYSHLVLPVTSSCYWYFTAYTGLYCLMPILNGGLRALTQRHALGVAAALLALSCSASVGARDVYGLLQGYSVLWLVVLYVIGAVIRLHVPRLPRARWCLLGAVLLPGLTVVQEVLCARLPRLAAALDGRALAGEYISPVVLLTAVALLMACLQCRVSARWVQKALLFFSSTAFGVYLIHVHPMLCAGLFEGRLKSWSALGNGHVWSWLGLVLGCAAAIYLVCACAERLRKAVFRI